MLSSLLAANINEEIATLRRLSPIAHPIEKDSKYTGRLGSSI